MNAINPLANAAGRSNRQYVCEWECVGHRPNSKKVPHSSCSARSTRSTWETTNTARTAHGKNKQTTCNIVKSVIASPPPSPSAKRIHTPYKPTRPSSLQPPSRMSAASCQIRLEKPQADTPTGCIRRFCGHIRFHRFTLAGREPSWRRRRKGIRRQQEERR